MKYFTNISVILVVRNTGFGNTTTVSFIIVMNSVNASSHLTLLYHLYEGVNGFIIILYFKVHLWDYFLGYRNLPFDF